MLLLRVCMCLCAFWLGSVAKIHFFVSVRLNTEFIYAEHLLRPTDALFVAAAATAKGPSNKLQEIQFSKRPRIRFSVSRAQFSHIQIHLNGCCVCPTVLSIFFSFLYFFFTFSRKFLSLSFFLSVCVCVCARRRFIFCFCFC